MVYISFDVCDVTILMEPLSTVLKVVNEKIESCIKVTVMI